MDSGSADFQSLIRRQLRSAISRLPREARRFLLRKLISLPQELPPDLQFRVARTRRELEESYHLLYDAHDPRPSTGHISGIAAGLRITPYHALPSTTILSAFRGGRVIGTVSMIKASSFGLPIESAYDLSHLKAEDRGMAEVASLCIAREYSGERHEVLFPLLRYLYEYSIRYSAIDLLVTLVELSELDFYEGLLDFRKIEDRVVENCRYSDSSTLQGEVWDLNLALSRYSDLYRGAPPQRNLLRFFTEKSFAGFRFPERAYYATMDPVLSAELMEYFFVKKRNVLRKLDERQKAHLLYLYPGKDHQEVFKAAFGPSEHARLSRFFRNRRGAPRFDVRCPVRVSADTGGVAEIRGGTLLNASRTGGLIRLKGALPESSGFQAEIATGPDRTARIEAEPVRRMGEGGLVAFKVVSADAGWHEMLDYLEERAFAGVSEDLVDAKRV